jgi:multiple antibiotic resistance protein
MFDQIIRDGVTLIVILNPFATLPIFIALTKHREPAERRRIAMRAVAIAAIILSAFLIAGQFLLEALGIHLTSFQIAGGIVLFLFGLRMIFASDHEDQSAEVEGGFDPSVFPLAMPSIAGSGAIMAVVVLTDNHRFSVPHQAVTLGVMLVILAINLLCLLAAGGIQRLIGETGGQIVSRVMGLILTAVAVETILAGIKGSFGS